MAAKWANLSSAMENSPGSSPRLQLPVTKFKQRSSKEGEMSVQVSLSDRLHEIRKQKCTVKLVVLLVSILLGLSLFLFWSKTSEQKTVSSHVLTLADGTRMPRQTDMNCGHHSCFDVYRCGYNDKRTISVYVYPVKEYIDPRGNKLSPSISKEFYSILDAIRKSKHYTSSLKNACIVVPSIDTLNQDLLNDTAVARILANLPSWKDGSNHILFNMLPGRYPDYHTRLDIPMNKALLAGAGLSSWTYRPEYDISLPIYNALTYKSHVNPRNDQVSAAWLLVVAQTNYHPEYRTQLEQLAMRGIDVLVMGECPGRRDPRKRCKGPRVYDYPEILQSAAFCLIIRGLRLSQTAIMDAMMMGCIPVVLSDDYIMPFSEVLDWKRASVMIAEEHIGEVVTILRSLSQAHIADMRRQVKFFWNNYLGSIKKITLTTLKILNDRVYPTSAWAYKDWNMPPIVPTAKSKNKKSSHNFGTSTALYVPLMPAQTQGFTAVLLTYDRLDMLYEVLQIIGQVPSLSKIIIVWNNLVKVPPPDDAWPNIPKRIKVIQTKENKLSNRFFPFKEIQTESILAIDDDILMLTPDEIQFGYEVWREFPDRLVGYPGRIHYYDNKSRDGIEYSSEWVNDVSMVLTGCAFHHKYFSHVYTYMMPAKVRQWVDDHMNCEDIAMNFLISNYTGKAPIKVTPRKRFKCPTCTKAESLWADPSHFVERSACMKEFIEVYGRDPLKTVEFRAEPLLMHEQVPRLVKMYNNIGEI